MLSQTRQPGFSGPGALRLSDVVALYEAERWIEAEMPMIDFLKMMLLLDSALIAHYEEGKPRGK